jgi:hypothetical protein
MHSTLLCKSRSFLPVSLPSHTKNGVYGLLRKKETSGDIFSIDESLPNTCYYAAKKLNV